MSRRRLLHARRRREGGSSVLYAVVLSPVLLLSLALAVQVGALQLTKQRLHSALDQAAVTAVAGTAQAQPAAHLEEGAAVARLRAGLVDNLRPLQDDLVDTTPEAVADAAEIAVISDVPAADPFDPSTTLRRPTLEVRAHVPVRTGLLRLAGVPATVILTLRAAADLRVVGGASA